MRSLLAALSLGCALAAPAVATDWNADLEHIATDAGSQSPWRAADQIPLQPVMSVERRGEGWSQLDGWMRGDPVLRQWVIGRFDSNRDTWLSDAEASDARRTFYSMADLNRSGRLTSEEFVSGWAVAKGELLNLYALAG